MKLAPARQRRLDELVDELLVVRLDGPSVFELLVHEVGAVLQLETLVFYALADGPRGWELRRFHAHHDPGLVAPFRRLVASAHEGVMFYNPLDIHTAASNRLVEATAWIDATHGAGAWLRSRMCQEVMAPLGCERHQQVRALLCDGPELLGWFGTLARDALAPEQLSALTGLLAPLRRRLVTERTLDDGAVAIASLDVMLERIGAPAFVLGRRGRLLAASAAGRAILASRRAELTQAVTASEAGRAPPPGFEVTRLGAGPASATWLVVVRGDSADQRLESAAATAAAAWQLSPRQREVLGYVVRGAANTTIAAHLQVSTRAVELHVTALLARAGVENRASLVACVLGG